MADKKKKGQSAFKIYDTYSFADKDPVIDRMRGPADEYTYAELSRVSGVSATTIYNWFEGPTRRPSYAAVIAVMRAMGFKERYDRNE
jgi:DNA-binding phage protein